MKQKRILLAALACAALLLPFAAVGAFAFALAPQYTQTFLGELGAKYDRLNSVEEPKIVIIGGSSTAFGLDCARIEEYTGMPTVNFGLYASLGTKAMIDLSKSNVGEGDIVILAPEMDAQTLSLFFNGEAMWQAADGRFEMLRYIGADDRGAMLGGLWDFAAAKFRFWRSGSAPDPAGVYNRSSFNEYGDIVYVRPYNVMALGYDPTTVIDLSPSIVDPAFIDYVNEYVEWCEKKGASVYFSFSPMNREALREGTAEDGVYAFFCYLAECLDCEIISDITECILDWEYFYDTNFHLNDAGVQVHTSALIRDIRRVLGNTERLELPEVEPPVRPDVYVEEAVNDTTGFFIVETVDGKQTLTGITELGRQQISLTLPLAADGLAVEVVAADAFEECEALEEIVIGADTYLSLICDGAFAGADRLKRIRISCMPDDILVGGGLMEGAAESVRILVPREHYGDYAAHYFWSEFMARIEVAE